jgi:hypothetical protein
LYRARVLARLNKYVYASAFEKTYNRVFSGSRVPITDINPFNIILDEKDKISTFEIWADSTQNEILIFAKGDEDEGGEVKNTTLDENDSKVDIESFDNTKKINSKYVNTYKLDFDRKNKFKSQVELSFIHNNLGEILFQRLKRSRLNNFKYISNNDIAFIYSNAGLLRKRASKFMSAEAALFTRQTPNSIDYYRYIANKEFELSEKYKNEVTKIRKELNKVRPGHIYKDTFFGEDQ